jgi:diphthamide synthase (EF-2-diphthine--ammonia ligase)
MGEKFLGRILSHEIVEELQSIDVDPCGENGEFHTLVLNCPLFKKRIEAQVTGKVLHENYWFSHLQLVE